MTSDSNLYNPIHTGRLYEQIVAQIEARILSGDLHPGDQLPAERELANQFGVSRTAVREAVRTLTQKGLVEVYPGKGTFVTDSTSRAVRHSLGLMIRIGNEEGTRDLLEVRPAGEDLPALRAAPWREEEELAAQAGPLPIGDRAPQGDREAEAEQGAQPLGRATLRLQARERRRASIPRARFPGHQRQEAGQLRH